MCTVTYLPHCNGQYVLTSSRDEKIIRPVAFAPAIYPSGLMYPCDPLHQGTWIAGSDSGRTLCLLNGGFKKHIPEKNYKKSRGLVLLDAFEYDDAQDFLFRYDLTGIEPFTLIFIDLDSLNEIRWDGQRAFVKNLSVKQAHIWSSVTLYSHDIIQKRKDWFSEWLKLNPVYGFKEILDFHHFAGAGDSENDVLMNRNDELKTISITSVRFQEKAVEMIYEDLQTSQNFITKLPLKISSLNDAIKN